MQVECAKDARLRGWSEGWIVLTRVTQHFTNFSLLILIFAHMTGERELAAVASVLELIVFIVYHILCRFDKTLLTYHDAGLAEQIMGLSPPMNLNLFPWLVLHLQHTIAPFTLWGSVTHLPEDVFLATAALLLYAAWNSFCERVQGRPAYPIQERLYKRSPILYRLTQLLVVALCVCCALILDDLF